MLKLHAIYRQEGPYWDATIEFYPFIRVDKAECLDSAKELLAIYAAEELLAAYKGKRCQWEIVAETIELYSIWGTET